MKQECPIMVGRGGSRRRPAPPRSSRERYARTSRGVEPISFKGRGRQLNGEAPAARQVHDVRITRGGKAEISAAHELVVRLQFPPRKRGEEVDHVRVTLQH